MAVLPIGDFYTMGPRRRPHAVRLLGVTQVLCGHFGTFPALSGTPAALRDLVGGGRGHPGHQPGGPPALTPSPGRLSPAAPAPGR